MIEVVYRAFSALPSREPSLLHSSNSIDLSALTFYMDDFFGGFQDFDEQYKFLRMYFFLRVEQARFRLSFKKLKLFMKAIKALDITYYIESRVRILKDRIEKIAR